MIHWRLETLEIKRLKQHPKNPRQINKQQLDRLSKTIDKFGLIDKPIVNSDDTIIGGHQRIRILKTQKAKKIECWVPDRLLEDKEIDELCISLNLNQGQWDYDILANSWDMQDLLEYGFSEETLMGITKDAEKIEGDDSEEDAETPEPPKEPKTRTGDLYVLGNHRLLCGDSTLPDDVAKVLDGAEPILMVTDPPYGVNYDASWRDVAGKGCRAKGKVQNDDRVNWGVVWHLFPGSSAYVWCASLFSTEVAKSLHENDFEIKNQIIWAKQHFALSRGDYHWQHEPCWYAVKKGHKHNWQGSRKESTLWEISNQNAFGNSKQEDERTNHSTQKPLECMARPIRNNSAEGEGVYDPFVGSGTTLIACEKLNRKCYAIEIDPAYCDIIVERWIKYRIKNSLPYEFARNGEVLTELTSHE